jgi:predicted nucleic acid-binding protein
MGFRRRTGTEAALALHGEQLIGPAIWLAEAANALWQHVRLGETTAAEAIARMTKWPRRRLQRSRSSRISPLHGTEISHPMYDCLYLALAIHYDAHVITDDRRFAAAASRPGLTDRVRLLST